MCRGSIAHAKVFTCSASAHQSTNDELTFLEGPDPDSDPEQSKEKGGRGGSRNSLPHCTNNHDDNGRVGKLHTVQHARTEWKTCHDIFCSLLKSSCISRLCFVLFLICAAPVRFADYLRKPTWNIAKLTTTSPRSRIRQNVI